MIELKTQFPSVRVWVNDDGTLTLYWGKFGWCQTGRLFPSELEELKAATEVPVNG